VLGDRAGHYRRGRNEADANFGINAVDAVGQDELPRSGVKYLPLILNEALHRLA
jgi:hypothetical protein